MKCVLSGELTIATAADVRTRLLQDLASADSFELDTSEVTDVDGAGIQLLLAAFRSAEERKVPVIFAAADRGVPVGTAFAQLGLAEAWSDANHDGRAQRPRESGEH